MRPRRHPRHVPYCSLRAGTSQLVYSASAHAIAPTVQEHPRVLADLHAAAARFGILHSTIQLEGEPLAACCGDFADSPLTPATR